MTAIGDRIKSRRLELGYTQTELANKLGYKSRASINKIEMGKNDITQSRINDFAVALETTPAYLMGWDEFDQSVVKTFPWYVPGQGTIPEQMQRIGIERPTWQCVPLLGDIACGEPILAEENIEEYVSVSANVKCDFVLRCKGDSMEPRLNDGDIVFIRQQPDVTDGQIAAVLIESNATLKHVYHLPSHNGVQLVSDNPSYAPMLYAGENAANIRILGKAVAYQRAIR